MTDVITGQDSIHKMTRDELIALYRDFQIESLRKVYQDKYAPKQRMTDLVAEFRRQACKHSFENDAVYQAVLHDIDAFSHQLGGLINGARGELKAGKALRHLRTLGYVLENVCLEYDGETVEIDELVLAAKVFAIETKYYTASVIIDEHGIIHGRGGNWHDRYNVIDRNRAREFVLEGILAPVVGDVNLYEHIESVICFANDNADFEDRLGKYEVCRCADLPLIIEDAAGEDAFTADQLDAMRAAIEGHLVKATYPVEFDLAKLSDGIDYVLDLIARNGADGEDPVTINIPAESAQAISEAVESGNDLDWSWLAYAAPVAAAFAVGVARKPEILRNVFRHVRL